MKSNLTFRKIIVFLIAVSLIGVFPWIWNRRKNTADPEQSPRVAPAVIAIDSTKDFDSLSLHPHAKKVFIDNAIFGENESLPVFGDDVEMLIFNECTFSLTSLKSLAESSHVSEFVFAECAIENLNETRPLLRSNIERFSIEINGCRGDDVNCVAAFLALGNFKRIELKNLEDPWKPIQIESSPGLRHLIIRGCGPLSFKNWNTEEASMADLQFIRCRLEQEDVKKFLSTQSGLILFRECSLVSSESPEKDSVNFQSSEPTATIWVRKSPDILEFIKKEKGEKLGPPSYE
jgi:hypothetical protein